MHFAFVSAMGGYPWGGSEELWSRTALRLREHSHTVTASVAFRKPLSPRVTDLSTRGINVLVRPSSRGMSLRRVWQRITRSQERMFSWLLRPVPDLVILSLGWNYDDLKCMKFCHDAGIPYAVIVHCNTEEWYPSDDVVEEMAQLYKAARKVFCVSAHNLQLLRCQIADSLPNGAVVWNPYNVVPDDPPAWPNTKTNWNLAAVARLEPKAKGQDLLLAVLAGARWRERPIEVNLYGAGPWERTLRRLAAYLKLTNVHFRGHLNDVRAIWEHNHMLILPSRFEGMPLAIVEAMWSARPAVVTDIGGNAELCVDNETGFVASAPTSGLFEHALERAWERRADWESMGKAARARADKLIPRDPVSVFCDQLLECVSAHPTASVPA
jgi:glycosyltransferase involved in cell wall biosynthesis